MGVCSSHTKKLKLTIIDKHTPRQVDLADPRSNRLYKNHTLRSITAMSIEHCTCDEYESSCNVKSQNIINMPDLLLNQHKGAVTEAGGDILARERTSSLTEVCCSQSSQYDSV